MAILNEAFLTEAFLFGSALTMAFLFMAKTQPKQPQSTQPKQPQSISTKPKASKAIAC